VAAEGDGELPPGPRTGRLRQQDAEQEAHQQHRHPEPHRRIGENDDAGYHARHAEEQAQPPDPPAVLRLPPQGQRALAGRLGQLHCAPCDDPAIGRQPPRPGQQHAWDQDGDEQENGDEAAHTVSVPRFSAGRGVMTLL